MAARNNSQLPTVVQSLEHRVRRVEIEGPAHNAHVDQKYQADLAEIAGNVRMLDSRVQRMENQLKGHDNRITSLYDSLSTTKVTTGTIDGQVAQLTDELAKGGKAVMVVAEENMVLKHGLEQNESRLTAAETEIRDLKRQILSFMSASTATSLVPPSKRRRSFPNEATNVEMIDVAMYLPSLDDQTNMVNQTVTTPSTRVVDLQIGELLRDIFGQVEGWVQLFAVVPIACLNQRIPGCTELFEKVDVLLGRFNASHEIMTSAPYQLVICAIVNRELCNEVFETQLFKNSSSALASQYHNLIGESLRFFHQTPMDAEGRGKHCRDLALMAQNIIAEADFWQYKNSEVDRVTNLILQSIRVLIPAAQMLQAFNALRIIVDKSFTLAMRFAQEENNEYNFRFLKNGDRYDPDTMKVRDPSPADVSSHTHMIRLAITPIVIDKTFKETLNVDTVHHPDVMLSLKRGAEKARAGYLAGNSNNTNGKQPGRRGVSPA